MAAGLSLLLVLLLTIVGVAGAAGLEALSDKGSGRMFALRVTPPAVAAGAPAAAPTPAALRATADAFIVANRELIGLENPARDLIAAPATTDHLGLSRVKYFQTHRGLDVLGGEIAVHLNRGGQVTYVKAKVARELPAEVTPRLTELEAQDAALEAAVAAGVPLASLTVLSTRLLVLPLGIVRNEPSEATHLAWEVEVVDAETRGDRFGEGYYVDAGSGELLLQLTRILHYTPVTRQVYDCGGGTGSTCWLDVQSAVVPGYYHGRSEGIAPRGPYPTHANLPTLFHGSTDVDSMFQHVQSLHDYVSTKFLIDGANGFGGLADWPNVPQHITRAVVHNDFTGFNPPCPGGAYFSRNTGTMTYCLGMLVPDVEAHEYSHGVVHHSFHDGSGFPIGISYQGQTASLDEGFADFLGEAFEVHTTGASDWITGTGTGYLYRNLADPNASLRWDFDNLPYPDRFYGASFYCGLDDAGGAHSNMTVPAHAFYLIAQGGQHATNGCLVQAQGIDVALQIFFRGWRSYFSRTESFNEAYADLIQACDDLYPSAVCAEVTKALQAVEMDQPGLCSGIPGVQPPCSLVGVEHAPAPSMDGIRLLGQHPAPGAVRFAYRTARDGRVEVRIHDLAGRLLARPLRAWQLAGDQVGAWDGRLESGGRARTGAYFLSVTLDGEPIATRKLLLLR